MENELSHYGTPRHSGRYPWGSGDSPYQRYKTFQAHVSDLKKQGFTEKQIAASMEMTTNQLRAKLSIAKDEVRKYDVAQALKLKEKGMSNVAIGERIGCPESTVRNLLKPDADKRAEMTMVTADILKQEVEGKNYINVGTGVENYLNCSRTKLDTALAVLEDQGYSVQNIYIDQMGTGKKTTMKVLTKGDITTGELWANRDKIAMPTEMYATDNGTKMERVLYPTSVDSSRVKIKYAEEGGIDKDGLIEIRRGVEDLSLGNSTYAQVRIAVDGSHYLKGMAMYSDNLPDGVDIVFNTNKKEGTPMLGPKDNTVLKPLKAVNEMDQNPFGAAIRQKKWTDENGVEHPYPINIVNEEGDWGQWAKSLSTQVLSKQPVQLAKRQCDLAYDIKESEFKEIMSLTNPEVKESLLRSFADDCDANSVSLKAAALPRQASHVILPFPDMDEHKIYAPNYQNGDKVVLIRYPHGGKFEIPELVVDNTNAEAKKLLGNARDAVGISPKVAGQLSGADFDGDTVLVIPNNNGQIKHSSPLKQLENFDPKTAYPKYEGMKVMDKRTRGIQMGLTTNLIADMTIQMAPEDEIARAVKHSMVVIDANKHELDWKKSESDQGIPELRLKYQGRTGGGAATLISRASSRYDDDERKEGQWVKDPETGKSKKLYTDPETGEKLYTYTGAKTWKPVKDKEGNVVEWVEGKAKKTTITKMEHVKDAHELSSGTMMEEVYANYANKLKALGNSARKEAERIEPTKADPEARKKYEKELKSLDAQLTEALKNAPLERQAQVLAGKIVEMQKEANPGMDKDDLKKAKGRAITEARSRVGAKKTQIKISDREWEAIQNKAVSSSKLKRILANTDMDSVKQRAMPRTKTGIAPGKLALARTLLAQDRTRAEVAEMLGVSTTTLDKALNP